MKLGGVSDGNHDHCITSGPIKNYNLNMGLMLTLSIVLNLFYGKLVSISRSWCDDYKFLEELDKKVHCRSVSYESISLTTWSPKAVTYYSTVTYEVFSWLSEINVNPDLKYFLQFLKAQRYMVMLRSGQVLFVHRHHDIKWNPLILSQLYKLVDWTRGKVPCLGGKDNPLPALVCIEIHRGFTQC